MDRTALLSAEDKIKVDEKIKDVGAEWRKHIAAREEAVIKPHETIVESIYANFLLEWNKKKDADSVVFRVYWNTREDDETTKKILNALQEYFDARGLRLYWHYERFLAWRTCTFWVSPKRPSSLTAYISEAQFGCWFWYRFHVS